MITFLNDDFLSDQEEFLYLMNLLKTNRVRKRQPVGGEQGWLNEVYLWEKFDIGSQYNVRSGVAQMPGLHTLVNNATIFHFASRWPLVTRCESGRDRKASRTNWVARSNKTRTLRAARRRSADISHAFSDVRTPLLLREAESRLGSAAGSLCGSSKRTRELRAATPARRCI